ncbi:MAG TPA: selenocysteine-specific translation elongation factor [Noviherbaspirillum sp.]|jgi:selenocysteine-specific elongation factor|uniref:selenocysteine-specific translation elongation factor n=1 Tax=Noviherbaspirillum sp. TaxID=1926288 RepID=UPI002DDD237E|nr:selenocysteine-specific translation elongation factor [Noviherbaspirillum sp.]HEV2610323.1 selenocysteine-specific translation elongation factor [Noviherbaspirillum sp.]
MIIATAGHVDHGKTSLVKALTGVDTDRLKEEKLRGMSIEPGFAYADLGTGIPIGFVDVPGHERFIRNMLAGVAAVDFALLVVAADDGPMPQTFEHLAILDLLGIRHGAVALTKVDRVSPARIDEVRADLMTMLATTALRDAPVFPVAALLEIGLDPLRTYLASVALALPPRRAGGNFRLTVDRCFTLTGAGMVVTGAAASGTVCVGDQVLVAPQGIPVRVRGIHVHNRVAGEANEGWRCALNLSGADLKRAAIERGNWIVAPRAHVVTLRFDARITVLPSREKPLSHWTPVHLHCGTASISARVALLEGHPIVPGKSALAQIVADEPIHILRGDRFILRDQSAQHTIAGGFALDPFSPARGRTKPERLAYLAAMAKDKPGESLDNLLATQAEGVAIESFALTWNLTEEEMSGLTAPFSLVHYSHASTVFALPSGRWQDMRHQLEAALRSFHVERPEAVGPPEATLAELLGMRTLSPAWRAALKSLNEEGDVARDGICFRLANHRPRLTESDEALLGSVGTLLREAGLRALAAGELAKEMGMDLAPLLDFLERVSHLGHLVRISKNRFFLPATVDQLVDVAVALARESDRGVFDAATYRDRSGIGRNVTIEVLEFMDRVRITRYAGGVRSIVS